MEKLAGVLGVILVFSSCSMMTEEKYIQEYKLFINEVKNSHHAYTVEEWQKADKNFYRYSNELYGKFEKLFSAEDKILLAKYRIEYDIYRYQDEARETILDVFNAYFAIQDEAVSSGSSLLARRKDVLKREIENYMKNGINDDADFLIEQGQRMKNIFSRVLSEIGSEGENIQDD